MDSTITHMMVKVQALEDWRTSKGDMTRAYLARTLGVSPRTMARYYTTGRFPWAHFKLLQSIITQTGGDPNSIIGKPVYTRGAKATQRVLEGNQ